MSVPIPLAPTTTFATSIGSYVGSLMTLAMTVAALLVFFYLVWGAIDWITSGGDKGKTEKAREKMTGAIIGIIILSAVTAIMLFIQWFLNIDILRFGGASSGAVARSGGGTGGCGSGSIGRVVSDGGAGGYCTGGGAAMVKCVASEPGIPYPHWQPCRCTSGSPASGFTFTSC